jgi:hypothetical protein
LKAAERSDLGPVGLAGAVDDAGSDAGGGEVGENLRAVRREPRVVEVVVGVEEHGSFYAKNAKIAKEGLAILAFFM